MVEHDPERIPDYIQHPIYYGDLMIGVWDKEVWFFRWHINHWCSDHKASEHVARKYWNRKFGEYISVEALASLFATKDREAAEAWLKRRKELAEEESKK